MKRRVAGGRGERLTQVGDAHLEERLFSFQRELDKAKSEVPKGFDPALIWPTRGYHGRRRRARVAQCLTVVPSGDTGDDSFVLTHLQQLCKLAVPDPVILILIDYLTQKYASGDGVCGTGIEKIPRAARRT